MRRLVFLVSCALLLASPATVEAAPGALDPSFGSGGISRPLDGAHYSVAVSSNVAPDGKVLVTGAQTSIGLASNEDDFSWDLRVEPVVTRYLADGRVDTSFGTNGAATVYVQNHLSAGIRTSVQPDGKIVVTGVSLGLLSATTFVARLNADGSLDSTFADDGVYQLLPRDLNALVPVSVDVRADGRIVVGAASFSGDLMALSEGTGKKPRRADLDVVVLQLLPDGSLDTAFGSGGMTRFDRFGTSSLDVPLDAVLDESGRLLVTGTAISDDLRASRSLLVRFTSTGAVDTAFGGTGFVQGPADAHLFETGTVVATTADGGSAQIVVRTDDRGDGAARSYVRRIAGDGTTIAFGSDVGAHLPKLFAPTSMVTLADGRIVVGGVGSWVSSILGGDTSSAAVLRLTAQGTLDRGFDREGITYLGSERSTDRFSFVSDLERGPGGTILVAGDLDGVSSLARLYGDALEGAGRARVRVRIGVHGRRASCGATVQQPCVLAVDPRGRRTPIDIEATNTTTGQTAQVRLDDDEDDSFSPARLYRVPLSATGRGRLAVQLFHRGPGLYRLRVHLPATGAAKAGISAPLFVRVPGRVHNRHEIFDSLSCSGNTGAGSSTQLAASTAIACGQVRAARRQHLGVREAALRILGR